jgi:hypothetical protein
MADSPTAAVLVTVISTSPCGQVAILPHVWVARSACDLVLIDATEHARTYGGVGNERNGRGTTGVASAQFFAGGKPGS